ncbi:MAG: cell wall-active antibiotics response protein [Paludibacter sp.]|jgi:predicted membrane protein|nr:cell wall-active antibiotics response protein [Paludibacter sp.]
METKAFHHRSRYKGIAAGIILIVVGLLFFIDGAFKPIILSWQMLLILIGLGTLISQIRHFFSGVILVLIGGLFLIPKLAISFPAQFEWVQPDFIAKYWPLLFVAAGILVIIQLLFFKSEHSVFAHNSKVRICRSTDTDDSAQAYMMYKNTTTGGFINRDIVFSGSEEIYLDPIFKGGQINTVFGGMLLDLRKTTLAEGVTTLYIHVVFGGVSIIVPDSWKVEMNMSGIFGGASDSRFKSNDEEVDSTRRLVINGECVFAGCEVTNKKE